MLEQIAKSGNALLVVADDVDGGALATLVINKVRGVVATEITKSRFYRGDALMSMGASVFRDLRLLLGINT